jgi:hypothetical protein
MAERYVALSRGTSARSARRKSASGTPRGIQTVVRGVGELMPSKQYQSGEVAPKHTLDINRLAVVFAGLQAQAVHKTLTLWEKQFLADVHRWWSRGKTLSDNQLQKLEELWVRRVP